MKNTSSNKYIERKWTNNEPYVRSRRMKHQIEIENSTYEKKIELNAYSSSLNHDENTWEMLNQMSAKNNKREDLDIKIAERGMVQQIGNNPFLSNNTYIEDISNRDKFMKPMNTTNDYSE